MTARPQSTSHSGNAIRRVRLLRKARGWSAQHLVDQLAVGGCPMGRSTLAGLENGQRSHLTVDELCAFAAVFGVPVEHLLSQGPICPTCDDQPLAGFRCLSCGLGTAEVER